jgi:hypothetical protein
MRDLRETDGRAVVLIGRNGDLKREWEITKTLRWARSLPTLDNRLDLAANFSLNSQG